MQELPDSVMKFRNKANACADELHDAWNALNQIETPTLRDLEQWVEIRNRFVLAQQDFEEKLSSFLKSGLNA